MLLAQGDAAGSLTDYRAALAIDETLAAKDPTNADRQRDLSESHGKVGDALLVQKNPAGALAEYRAALAIVQRLQAKDPTNAELREQTSKLTTKVATCCSAKRSAQPR